MPEGHLQEAHQGPAALKLVRRVRGVYYGWWLVIASAAIGFFGSLSQYSAAVFFLPISQELSLSRAQTSLVFSASRLEGGVFAPFVGWATDKLGSRSMLLFGNTLAGVGFILLGTLAHGFWSLLFIWVFIMSVGFQTGFFTALVASMNTWFARRRTTAISFISSSNRVGGFVWTPVLAYYVLLHGWRITAVAAGILILVVTLPISLLFRRSPESMGLYPDGAKDPINTVRSESSGHGGGAATNTTTDFTVAQAVQTRAFWQFSAASLCQMASLAAITVHMIPILVWKGLSPQAAANIFSLVPLIGIPMTLVYGQLGDRLSPARVMGVATLVSTIGLAFLTFGHGLWPLYVFVVLHGLGESAGALSIAIVGDFFGRKSFATLQGVRNAIGSPLGFAAPIFAGWVYDQTGSYLGVLVPVFILRMVSVPLFLLLRRPKAPVASGPLRL